MRRVVELGRNTATPAQAIAAIHAANGLLAQTLATRHGLLQIQALTESGVAPLQRGATVSSSSL